MEYGGGEENEVWVVCGICLAVVGHEADRVVHRKFAEVVGRWSGVRDRLTQLVIVCCR